ncbi:hypothetical protein Sjap_022562 [Stephania japonica]|uniref:Uncharacterized protein n=1 Tax=Stephania japonica TaxID=461633 RepID=A0AAP0HV36_9MAGN
MAILFEATVAILFEATVAILFEAAWNPINLFIFFLFLEGGDVVPNLSMEEHVSEISKKQSRKGNDQWAINPGIKNMVEAAAKATSQAHEAFETDANMHDDTCEGGDERGEEIKTPVLKTIMPKLPSSYRLGNIRKRSTWGIYRHLSASA